MSGLKDAARRFVTTDGPYGDEGAEMESKSWYFPQDVAALLRKWSSARTGSTDSIGLIIAESMRSSEAPSPWPPHDYASLSKEHKTAVGFSVPQQTVDDFTEGLAKQEFGAAAANAVMAHILRQEGAETDEPISHDGHDLSNVTVESALSIPDWTVNSFADSQDDVGYKSRRGVIAANCRYKHQVPRKFILYTAEDTFGVSRDASRRDANAILEQATKESEVLCKAPVRRVKEELDRLANPLNQTLGINEKYLAEFSEPILYNHKKLDEPQLWASFGRGLNTGAADILDTEYYVPKPEQRVANAVEKVDSLFLIREALNAFQAVVPEHLSEVEVVESIIEDKQNVTDVVSSEMDKIRRKNAVQDYTMRERHEHFKQKRSNQ